MAYQLVPYKQSPVELSAGDRANNLILAIYADYTEITLEVKAFIAKSIYFCVNVAPLVMEAEFIDFAIRVVRSIGLTRHDENEVVEWLLNLL